ELRRRIEGRNTETKDTLEQRLARAEMEISMSDKFDKVILNDDLSLAVREVAQNIDNQLKKWGINR
ncbi:MAG: guanylate kinase, partial [Bacteroidales bacterium]|nr:guanylate kinase [Bacteroidales bacterium]